MKKKNTLIVCANGTEASVLGPLLNPDVTILPYKAAICGRRFQTIVLLDFPEAEDARRHAQTFLEPGGQFIQIAVRR